MYMRNSSFSLLYLEKDFSVNIFSSIYKSKTFRNNLNEGASPLGSSRLDTSDINIVLKQDIPTEHPEAEVGKQESSMSESKTESEVGKQDSSSATLASAVESTMKKEVAEKSQTSLMDNKWKPLQGVGKEGRSRWSPYH